MVSKSVVYTSIALIVILNLIILFLSIYGAIMIHNSVIGNSLKQAHSYMTWVAIISALALILFIAMTIFLVAKGGLTTESLQNTVNTLIAKKDLSKKQLASLTTAEKQTIKAKSSAMIFMIGAAVFLIVIFITGILSGVAWYDIGKQATPDNKAKIGYACAIINTILGLFLIILGIAIIIMMYFISKYQERLIKKADQKTHIKTPSMKDDKDNDSDSGDNDSDTDSDTDSDSDSNSDS